MAKCKHIFTEKIYDCCEFCGQRHNQDHCIKCDLAEKSLPLPCEPPSNCNDDSLRRHHYVNHIVKEFRYNPNPIDTEEYSSMSKRLSMLQGEMHMDALPISSWEVFIKRQMMKPYFKELNLFLTQESKTFTIYPSKQDVFKAFDLCPLETVRVVIIGQDPYHNAGEAMGLCFSTPPDVKIPPSLRNIFKEMKDDLKKPDYVFKNGDLTYLARQGCLLLNSSLTVRANEAGSHSKTGWNMFVENVVKLLNNQNRAIVYMLCGSQAKAKSKLISNPKHLQVCGNHPSPLSAHKGFFGNHYFTTANEFLIKNDQEPIKWLK